MIDTTHRKRISYKQFIQMRNTEPLGRQQNSEWQQYRNKKIFELLANGLELPEVLKTKDSLTSSPLCLNYHKTSIISIHQLQDIVKKGFERIGLGQSYAGYSAKSLIKGLRLEARR